MKKIFLIGALCLLALTESVGAKSIKLWKTGENGDGRGLAVRDNDRTICPKGKTKTGEGCVSCGTVLSNCEWCSSTTECTKCKKGYIVKDGKCQKNGCDTDDECEANQACDTIAKKCERLDCQRGTYLNNHKCVRCPDECSECTSATVCTACKTNYELEGTSCTQIHCPTGQYVEHSECHPCAEAIENCGECSTATTCTKCENGTVLEYGKCVEPKCKTDSDCAVTEYCNSKTKTCENVVCDDGYEVSEHTCLPSDPETDAECDENTDCEDDEICVDGGTEIAACRKLECNDPNQTVSNHTCVSGGCTVDDDCHDEQYCNNGTCENLSCGTYYCGRANHQCVLCDYCCMSDADCAKYGSGISCINHICDMQSSSGGSGCTYDSGCASNQTCQGGSCVYLQCAPGKEPVNHICTNCAAGKYKNTTGSSNCEPCNPGYYASGTGNATCSPCAKGTYAIGSGNSSCTSCPSGQTTDNTASTSSSDCLSDDDRCSTNEDCPDTQKCENRTCVDVTCDHACYTAGNHKCVKKSEDCCVTDLDCEPGTCLKTPKAQTGICRDSTCTYTDANTCKNNTPNCKYCKKDGDGCYTCSMYNETASGCTESQTEFELYGVKFCCPSGVVAGQTPNWYNRCMQETQDAPNSCVCKSTSACGYVKVGGWCVWNGNGNQCSAQWCENM